MSDLPGILQPDKGGLKMAREANTVDKELSDLWYAIDGSTLTSFEFAYDTWDQWPAWFKTVLNSLYVFVENQEILYVSTSLYEDDVEAGQVVVFTADLVVLAETLKAGGYPTTTVRSWPRWQLTRVEVADVRGDVTHRREMSDWPDRLSIKLTYGNGETLPLPLAKSPGRDGWGRLREFYSALRDDLTAGAN